MSNIFCALPLGLDGVKIGLHLLNFVILMVGLTLLFYKPVVKFIKKRQDFFDNQQKENEETKLSAEQALDTYTKKLDSANEEIEFKKSEAQKAIASDKEKILSQAKLQADSLIKNAEEECEKERISAINALQDELADVAITIASNILEREISKEENTQIIEDCVKEWSEDD